MTQMKAEYVDHMGTDLTVVNAARVSFDKHHDEFDESDAGLLRYLARNNHWTPFAHPTVCLRLTAPIPIRTQFFKHKVGFTENEVSRRYVSDTPDFYYPEVWRAAPTGGAKQGSGTGTVDKIFFHGIEESWWDTPGSLYSTTIEACVRLYESMVEGGIAPEQARFVLPQGMMTSWYWTGSLSAYARFYKLRSDSHAQMEIQELAKQVDSVIRPLFPESWKVLCDPA